MKKKLFAISEAAMLVLGVWLALFSDVRLFFDVKPALAEYSWTDTIIIYKDVTSVYTDIRTFTNNETFPIDVKVYVTSTNGIHLLQYYELSVNGTDFIIISEGAVIRSGDTYYGLESGQKLCFTVEAKPTDLAVVGDTVTVGIIFELYPALYAHDVAVITVIPAKTVVGQGFSLTINVIVENQGDYTETFNVTVYAHMTAVETQEITLTSRNSATITFTWNTSGFVKGSYTISAYAWPVPGETDTTDNTRADGWVVVAMKGDISGTKGVPDGKVDIDDVIPIALAYASTKGPDGNYWHSPPCKNCPHNPNYDITDDGIIDIDDVIIPGVNYGKTDP